jgi:hypothetical protein
MRAFDVRRRESGGSSSGTDVRVDPAEQPLARAGAGCHCEHQLLLPGYRRKTARGRSLAPSTGEGGQAPEQLTA